MATDHTTIGTDLGKIIRVWEVMDDVCTGGSGASIDDIDVLKAEYVGVMDADASKLDISLRGQAVLADWWNTMQALKTRWIQSVFTPWVMTYLKDRSGLNSTGRSVASVLSDLYDQMTADSKTILWNTITLGTVTAASGNTGDGTVYVSKMDIWGNDNQTIQTDDVLFVCINDVRTNGVTAGKEVFSWVSAVHGAGPRLYCAYNEGADAQGQNRIVNGDFEDFTVHDTPDSWDVDNGTVGTHIEESTSKYRGSKCLKLSGDGAQATIKISQSETAFSNYSSSKIEPRGMYCLSARINTTGAGAGDVGTLTIQFEGTAYAAGATEKIEFTLDNTAPTSYTLYKYTVRMPKAIPSDFELVIKITNTCTAGTSVFIDNLIVCKMVEFKKAGLFACVLPGATDFIAGNKLPDYFTMTTTNDWAGHFMSFLVRQTDTTDPRAFYYPSIGVAMPGSASPSAEYVETLCH